MSTLSQIPPPVFFSAAHSFPISEASLDLTPTLWNEISTFALSFFKKQPRADLESPLQDMGLTHSQMHAWYLRFSFFLNALSPPSDALSSTANQHCSLGSNEDIKDAAQREIFLNSIIDGFNNHYPNTDQLKQELDSLLAQKGQAELKDFQESVRKASTPHPEMVAAAKFGYLNLLKMMVEVSDFSSWGKGIFSVAEISFTAAAKSNRMPIEIQKEMLSYLFNLRPDDFKLPYNWGRANAYLPCHLLYSSNPKELFTWFCDKHGFSIEDMANPELKIGHIGNFAALRNLTWVFELLRKQGITPVKIFQHFEDEYSTPATSAAAEGSLDVLNYFVEHGITLQDLLNPQSNIAFAAIETNQLCVIDWLLAQKVTFKEMATSYVPPDSVPPDERRSSSLLLSLIQSPEGLAVLEQLLARGMDPKLIVEGTPLEAVFLSLGQLGRLELLKKFMEMKLFTESDVTQPDNLKFLIHGAASGQHLEILKWLNSELKITYGAMLELAPIAHIAAETNNVEILDWLIDTPLGELPISINDLVKLKIVYGISPIHFSAAESSLDALQWFLNKLGGNIENLLGVKTEVGATLIHFLAAKNNYAGLTLLNKLGMTAEMLSAVDHNGWNVFHYAASSENDIVLMALFNLLGAEQNLSALDPFLVNGQDGFNPIHIAIQNQNFQFVNWFIQKLGLLKVFAYRTSDGASLAHIFAQQGNTEALQYLIQNGISNLDIFETDNNGFSPLDYARQSNHQEAIAWLENLYASMIAAKEATGESGAA